MDVSQIQRALKALDIDGWLFFDHHRRDPIAYRILGLSGNSLVSRRWYYLIPASGEPIKLVHRVEDRVLQNLPGEHRNYFGWGDQHQKLSELMAGCTRVAMQYSSNCAIPYVSLVDAGTIELVRSFGVEVISSADLVQQFEACWTERQFTQHIAAGKHVDRIRLEAFDLIGERLRGGQSIGEYEVQQFILSRFSEASLTTDHGPVVAVNEHSSDPHYEPTLETAVSIQEGDLVLMDMWAKLAEDEAVYYDITWTGYCGQLPPSSIENVFEIVKDARKSASKFVIEKVGAGQSIAGFEVDDVARQYIRERGFGDRFFHRTGHSIGTEVHGTGANMDNLESHDERVIIPGTCFSIEPGVYLAEFGIRSEVDVYVGQGFARVTGEQQEKLVRI